MPSCSHLFFSINILQAQSIPRPKLVVGIVVDQMRWDYLYRYYDRYAENGGFKRLLKQGFSCENTFIPYSLTETACGHACVYTGTVPAINGIIANYWYATDSRKTVYCTSDNSVNSIGTNNDAGRQSPVNLLVTTIGDELKLATNFRAKVIGIALKDRGSILPAGQSANAAYWYDYKTGNWISSTYYMKSLPGWVNDFNDQKLVDNYYKKGWNTLYPISSYKQSSDDRGEFANQNYGIKGNDFPYNFSRSVGKDYMHILSMPAGNSLTAEFAKAAIIKEQLGADSITDMLTLSFSSTDYIGHGFGPNSVQVEDTYLRLDKDLGEFLTFLDEKVGKGQYTCFLTADHGVVSIPDFLETKRIKAGNTDIQALKSGLTKELKNKYGRDSLVLTITNHQVYLDMDLIRNEKLDPEKIKQDIINYIITLKGVERVFDLEKLDKIPLNATIKERHINQYNYKRSGQLQIIPEAHWLDGYMEGGTGHSVWNPYDSHIPLLWYGWGIKAGQSNREVYMTDIAVTLAAMLHIQMPSGSVGKVITEVRQP